MKLKNDRIVLFGPMILLIVPIVLSLIKQEVLLFPSFFSIILALYIFVHHNNTIEIGNDYFVIMHVLKNDTRFYYKDIVDLKILTDDFMLGRTLLILIKTKSEKVKVHLGTSISEKQRIAVALGQKVKCNALS